MSTQYGGMIIANEIGENFADTLVGDMLLYTDTPQQKIRFGTDIGSNAMLVLDNCNITFGGSVLAVDGSASNPSYAWSNNTTTGLYNTAAGDIGFAVDGAQVASIRAGGMDVLGSIRITNGSNSFGGVSVGGGGSLGSGGSVVLTANSISTEYIQDGAVTTDKLSSNVISTEKIQDGAVTLLKLSSNVISTEKIQDGAVTLLKLSSNVISTDKIQDAAVTSVKLSSNLSLTGNPSVIGNLSVGGDLTVSGNTFTIDTQTVLIEDNLITLNKNATGTPASFLVSGVEIERGDQPNYQFAFEEATQLFKVGMSNQLQAVTTRDDNLTAGYPYYNATSAKLVTKTFETTDLPDNIITLPKLATSIQAWTVSTSNVYIGTGTSSNQKYGVGNSNPQYKLDVTGDVYASGNIIAFSDRKYKTDIKHIENGLDKTLSLRGYTYNRIDDPSKRYAGVIAQEVQAVLPEVVETDASGNLSVAYGNLTALLIEAVRELSSRVTALESKP